MVCSMQRALCVWSPTVWGLRWCNFFGNSSNSLCLKTHLQVSSQCHESTEIFHHDIWRFRDPNHRLQPGWLCPCVAPSSYGNHSLFQILPPPKFLTKIYTELWVNVKLPGLQTCICVYIYKAFKMSSSHVVIGDSNWDFRQKQVRQLWTISRGISLVMTNTITNLCQVRMISESQVWKHLSNTTC